MDIITKTPQQFNEQDIDQLSCLAGIGFGQGNTPEMRADSLNHIYASDTIQLALADGELVAFAMTRRCLWRYSR